MSATEIGLFQLENLILSRTPFVFLNLSEIEESSGDVRLDSYLKNAEQVHEDRVGEHLSSLDKQSPVVLLCENGERSEALALILEKQGFRNVYVIQGGVCGLRDEL